jgi:phage FluMu protein Com
MHSLLDDLSPMIILDFRILIEILIIVLNFISSHEHLAMARTTSPMSHTADCDETRCECGQLIAKVCGQGLELKCKRCKRFVVIPFSSIKGWSTATS